MSVTLPDTVPATTPPPHVDVASVPPLSAEVREFCEKYSLMEYLPTTFRLLHEEFAPDGDIELLIRDDAEEDFTRLLLNIPVARDVPSVVASYHRFLERWIPMTTPDVGMRIVVIWTFQP